MKPAKAQSPTGGYVLALDQGTTSSRAVLFDPAFRPVALAQKELTPFFPGPGLVEQDPEEILSTQLETARAALSQARIHPRQVVALGIANQRETVVAWDRKTGKPLARALVWQDRRTASACARLKADGVEPWLRRKTGLVADPYFSATKMQWLLKNVKAVRDAAKKGSLAFGTIDSWLLWNLTGGSSHVTDSTNASRTLLYGLKAGRWDKDLLDLFGVPAESLPRILPCDGDFGEARVAGLDGIRICGVAGDQQAALVGHRCFAPGQMKNTYGTGCFLLRNSGTTLLPPPPGILNTVGFDLGGERHFAQEGAVLVGGAVVQFLRDQLGIIRSSEETAALAQGLAGNDGVYFVPAFTGLGTPYWDPTARGALFGLTRGTTKAHLVRAALESIAYQSAELIEAMDGKGSGVKRENGKREGAKTGEKGGKKGEKSGKKGQDLASVQSEGGDARMAKKSTALKADGGASRNDFLMQFQSDILHIPVEAAGIAEMTALGAAFLAGLGSGQVKGMKELAKISIPGKRFEPKMKVERARDLMVQWKEAVARAQGWERARHVEK